MNAPMLERRRIEAEILGYVYEILVAEFDQETAKRLIEKSVHQSSLAQGRALAEALNGPTSLQSFIDLQHLWQAGGTLEIEIEREDEEVFQFRVTRCKYSEMYREMGLADLGSILSCRRDATLCQGYDPNLTLNRTQTIMEGGQHCDFQFLYKSSGGDKTDGTS